MTTELREIPAYLTEGLLVRDRIVSRVKKEILSCHNRDVLYPFHGNYTAAIAGTNAILGKNTNQRGCLIRS